MLLLFAGAVLMWWLIDAVTVGAVRLAVLQVVLRNIVVVAWVVSGIQVLAVAGIVVGGCEFGEARLRGGRVVVVLVERIEEDAVTSRVSIENNSKTEVLNCNSPVVLAVEHSEGLPRDLEAALWVAFGIDFVCDVHDCPSVLPVAAAASKRTL
jgi:hypothetical protein